MCAKGGDVDSLLQSSQERNLFEGCEQAMYESLKKKFCRQKE